jgi:hypothetical protein
MLGSYKGIILAGGLGTRLSLPDTFPGRMFFT